MLSEGWAVDLEPRFPCYPSAIAKQASNSILYATTDGKDVKPAPDSFIRAFGLVCRVEHLRFAAFLSDCCEIPSRHEAVCE